MVTSIEANTVIATTIGSSSVAIKTKKYLIMATTKAVRNVEERIDEAIEGKAIELRK